MTGTMEVRGGKMFSGELAIMGKEGDTKVIWNADNADEVEQAKKTFEGLRAKGFTAFSVKGKDGEKDKILREFDPQAERIIMVPRVAGGSEDGASIHDAKVRVFEDEENYKVCLTIGMVYLAGCVITANPANLERPSLVIEKSKKLFDDIIELVAKELAE